MVNKPFIRPYFWGGEYLRGGWLFSHNHIGGFGDSLPRNERCSGGKKIFQGLVFCFFLPDDFS